MGKIIGKKRALLLIPVVLIVLLISFFYVPLKEGKSLYTILTYKEEKSANPIQEQNYNKMLISYGVIQERKTGTESFSTPNGQSVDDGSLTSDMNGNDVSLFDEYVRTHDTITYVLELGINRNPETTEPGEDLKGGIIKVKITLPPDADGDHNLFMGKDAWMKNISFNADKTEMTCYYEIPAGKRAAGGIQELTFTIFSGGQKKELSSEYTPKFEVWMEGNKNDNPDSTAESVIIEDENLKITGTPRATESISFNTTTQPGEYEGVQGYYVRFEAKINASGSAKGVIFPEAPFTSTIKLDYKYHKLGTNTGFINLPTDDPDLPDPVNGTVLLAYGRPCETTEGFYPNASSNSGYSSNVCAKGTSNVGDGKFFSWDSGTSTATQDGEYIHFTTTGNTYDGYISTSTIISNGFQLFVPAYAPDNADYEYQITAKVVELKYHDDLNEEHTVAPNTSSAVTLIRNIYIPEATGNYSISVQSYSDSNVIYSGNDTVVFLAGKKIKMYADVNATSEGNYLGGLERLCKIDTTNVTLEPYNTSTDIYTRYTSKTGYTSPTQENVVKKIGIYKANPEQGLRTAEEVNDLEYEDFDWYSSIAEAKEHGEPTAFYTDEPDYEGVVSSYLDFYIQGRLDVNLVGYNGMVKCQTKLYQDEARTIVSERGNRTYFKGYYNEETGQIKGGTPTDIGHTYQTGFYKLAISNKFTQTFNNSEKTNYNAQGESIDFQITPSLSLGITPDEPVVSTFRIEAIIPSEIYYQENSSNYEPVSVVKNDNGTTTVKWMFEDWDVTVPLPIITYSATISPYATNNSSKTIYSYLYDDINKYVASASSSKGLTITNLAGASLRKTMTRGFIDKGGNFEITDHVYNISQTTLRDIKTYEILPSNTDDKGSHMSGSYTYTLLSLSEGQKFYYTEVNPNSIEYTIDDLGNKSIKNINLETDDRFVEISVGETVPSTATMIATYIPQISSMKDIEFKYSAHFTGNQGGDKYVYTISASSSTLESAISTEPIEVIVAERIISGKAFEDNNRNNVYDENDSLLPNNQVDLLKEVEDEEGNITYQTIDTTNTLDDGSYSFSLDYPGKYKVKFAGKENYEFIPKGNINVPGTSKVNSNGESDIINHEDNPYQEIMEKGNYNGGYQKQSATLTVNHYIKGTTTKIADSNLSTVYYTDTYYTSQADNIPNEYRFDSTSGDPVSSTVDKDNIVVNYLYVLKDSTITTHYYIEGTTTKIAEDDIQSLKYTQSYTTQQIDTTTLDYEYSSTGGDSTSGIIDKDNYDIIYYYKLKKGTVVTHHYIYNGAETEEKVAPDVSKTYDYRQTYNTEESTEIPQNYELYRKTNNFTGVVGEPQIEVVYYYQLKNSTLNSTITKTGPSEITDRNSSVEYNINYNATIKEYIGDATITIVDTLPYEIDLASSDLSGGIYDSSNRTITWIENVNNINSYNETNETKTITITKNITIKYSHIIITDLIMVNSVKGTIVLSNNTREIQNQTSTDIKIPSKITIKYIDEENNITLDSLTENGIVGGRFTSEAKEFEGYKLVSRPSEEEHTFQEEDQTIYYKYERIKYNITTKVNGEGGIITGDEIVYFGENSTKDKIVITAEDGYVIDFITINGDKITIKEGQEKLILEQFQDVKENKVVEVTFKKAPINPDTAINIFSGITLLIGLLLINTLIITISKKKIYRI